MKCTPNPLLVVNPTASESEANSAKEAAKGTHVPSPHDKNGMGVGVKTGRSRVGCLELCI